MTTLDYLSHADADVTFNPAELANKLPVGVLVSVGVNSFATIH